MSTKRGARAAPRSTSSKATSTRVLDAASAERALHDVTLARVADFLYLNVPGLNLHQPLEKKLADGALYLALERQQAADTEDALRRQLATMQALVRGAAEAFDGTPTGQVLDGLLLQMQAAKGGAR